MSIIEMSLSGALIIGTVVIIRAFGMHRLPKKTFLILWLVALCRLLIPVSVPSQLSVFNLWSTGSQLPAVVEVTDMPFVPPVQIMLDNDNPNLEAQTQAEILAANDTSRMPDMEPLALVWLVGLLLSSLFFAALYIWHRKNFKISLPVKNEFIKNWLEANKIKRRVEVRISDKISTPLTYGIMRPVILLPKSIDWSNEGELNFVLTHELIHIRRFDALTKLVATAALCIHWFNPLVWIMYFIMNRDLEISCDEAVIKTTGQSAKGGYALTLIGMAERNRPVPALVMYSNFNKYAIEERINAIMKMKRTSLLGMAASIAFIGVTTAVFGTTGVNAQATQRPPNVEHVTERHGFRFDEPSAASITAEEAAALGMRALEQFFDVDFFYGGKTIYMMYMARVDEHTLEPVMTVEEFEEWLEEALRRGMSQDVTNRQLESFTQPVTVSAQPSMWAGTIIPPGANFNEAVPQYSFRVNAETGRVTALTYEPNAAELNELASTRFGLVTETVLSERIVISMEHQEAPEGAYGEAIRFFSGTATGAATWFTANEGSYGDGVFSITRTVGEEQIREVDNMEMIHIHMPAGRGLTGLNEQQNYDLSHRAMDLAEELGIFENEVSRAKIAASGAGGTFIGDLFEMEATIWILVQSADGENAKLTFRGDIDGEKVLVGISFDEGRGFDSEKFDWVNR